MSKKNELEFANFILRFGQERFLLNLVEEVVIPAFNSGLERSYGEVRHFFHNVEIINLGNEEKPVICIAGRYIKDMVVKREQVFDKSNGGIVKNKRSFQTSPSAIFILVLNNHRLIYLSETSYAPSLLDFQRTTEKFINEKYQIFIANERDGNNSCANKISANLKIIPLTSEESIGDFVNKYDLLKTVRIELITTNNELDNNGFFEQLRQSKEEVHSNVTTIIHDNGKNGLSKGEVTRQLEAALKQGNSIVQLKGKDNQGNKLEGSNEEFKVKSQLNEIPHTISEIAIKSYEIFQTLVERGVVNVGEFGENTSAIIKQLYDKLNRG
jgi:hypothetical protein